MGPRDTGPGLWARRRRSYEIAGGPQPTRLRWIEGSRPVRVGCRL